MSCNKLFQIHFCNKVLWIHLHETTLQHLNKLLGANLNHVAYHIVCRMDPICKISVEFSIWNIVYILPKMIFFKYIYGKILLWSPYSLCTIFKILLTLWNSEQKNGLLIKLFCFSSKLDEKQKGFINSPFFCSEFQSVSRIVKIVHSALRAFWSEHEKISYYIVI